MNYGIVQHQMRVDDEMNKLDKLHKRATTILLKCHTVFPFDLFPDTLIIDYNKVDIVYADFFKANRTISIPISHLNYVSFDAVMFLATLKLDVRGLEQNPPPLRCLKVRDADLAKNLIFGLITAEKHNVDLTHLAKEDIIQKLIEIGRSI